jgi:serine/threonine protein kinase
MLMHPGQVKLLDLGLALLRDDRSSVEDSPEERLVGTADYLAPEQIAGGSKVDGRTDLYSLGCTLYKLPAPQLYVIFTGGDPGGAPCRIFGPYHDAMVRNLPKGDIIDLWVRKVGDRPVPGTLATRVGGLWNVHDGPSGPAGPHEVTAACGARPSAKSLPRPVRNASRRAGELNLPQLSKVPRSGFCAGLQSLQ